jgi:hypothetical protein
MGISRFQEDWNGGMHGKETLSGGFGRYHIDVPV